MKRTVLIAYTLVLFYNVLATDTNVSTQTNIYLFNSNFICYLMFLCQAGKTLDEYVANNKDTTPIWLDSHLVYKRGNQFEEWVCDEVENYIRTIPWSQINKCIITGKKALIDHAMSSLCN